MKSSVNFGCSDYTDCECYHGVFPSIMYALWADLEPYRILCRLSMPLQVRVLESFFLSIDACNESTLGRCCYSVLTYLTYLRLTSKTSRRSDSKPDGVRLAGYAEWSKKVRIDLSLILRLLLSPFLLFDTASTRPWHPRSMPICRLE